MINRTSQHVWLGLLWRADLDLGPALAARIRAVKGTVASLAGLVAGSSLPLSFGLALFESKVDGAMRYGRWLFATADNAEELYESVYSEWARAFMGSAPWRNSDVARGELGWRLSGYARAVVDIAARRARLSIERPNSIYSAIFVLAESMGGSTWAWKSKQIMTAWDLPDYCEWEGGIAPLKAYLYYIKGVVTRRSLERWKNAVAAHDRPVEYSALASVPSAWPELLLHSSLPWDILIGHRSLARMRAGLIEVAHSDGRRTTASVKTCIGCGCRTRASFLHSLTMCPAWAPGCTTTSATMRVDALALLNAVPGSRLFAVAVRRDAKIELDANAFWKRSIQ